jgi:ABC-type phosphate transport system ATPase subunit
MRLSASGGRLSGGERQRLGIAHAGQRDRARGVLLSCDQDAQPWGCAQARLKRNELLTSSEPVISWTGVGCEGRR